MSELVFLKLGGSLLTDKRRERSFRAGECHRLGGEIRDAVGLGSIRLLLGHGAGSFAHYVAQRRRTADGLGGAGGWPGYAETRLAVMELNRLVLGAFAEAAFHPLAVSPSSCALASHGRLVRMEAAAIEMLLEQCQVPMIFGDAVLDDRQGFTICSTEAILEYLAQRLRPSRVLLACDVDGVFASNPAGDAGAARIPVVTPENFRAVAAGLARPGAADVTGGMAGKLEVLRRIAALPGVGEVRLFSGLIADAVRRALLGEYEGGTVIRSA